MSLANAQFSGFRCLELKTKIAVFSGCLRRNAQFSDYGHLGLDIKIADFSGCLRRNAQFSDYGFLEMQRRTVGKSFDCYFSVGLLWVACSARGRHVTMRHS